ncbi:MAG: TRAP transporter small permease [Hoeflea sp.]|uniref:TRAP transporter small permease subunit n=1 Tax=Hoeflea sp. TaxID=1940281 RepID=UPI001DCAF06B|nr:TRAP transporter small permease [Hoeflea sp.]MBU4530999.1 TRAP transporter small permease [Alphaproteobacteria bacterium]MBU4542774.1 TRAP transporter small permease [Alphaproteobacteria bacterium]MBU4552586.1 TRAP transporter small permease [Alphaproteobacteria bacterium]MBV1722891.1 TRAP transporter small permease [Hoeflea sp.]MBV1762802.1 TRAP transporter small permease [Hoeflea sp.]
MADHTEPAAHVDGDDVEIRSGLDRAVAGSTKFFAWAIFLAFLITVFEVISRYVFDEPTYWAHESTTFLIAAVFLIGGPIALARDKHIRVRIFYDTVSPRGRRLFDIVNSLIALVFFAGLAYAASIMSWKATHNPNGEIHFEGTGTSWNPPTPALLKILVLLCVSVMFVQTVMHLVKAVRRHAPGPTDATREK